MHRSRPATQVSVAVGDLVGLSVGGCTGVWVGLIVGVNVGGCAVGTPVGVAVGSSVGALVVGALVGAVVGISVGVLVVGALVGDVVGGRVVGALVPQETENEYVAPLTFLATTIIKYSPSWRGVNTVYDETDTLVPVQAPPWDALVATTPPTLS